VGRGHAAQIIPPPVPICGPHGPMEREKKGSEERLAVEGEKGKRRGLRGGGSTRKKRRRARDI
jgi:hypothetical protein